jgi:protein involved in polysaccharide export with SLBB domain
VCFLGSGLPVIDRKLSRDYPQWQKDANRENAKRAAPWPIAEEDLHAFNSGTMLLLLPHIFSPLRNGEINNDVSMKNPPSIFPSHLRVALVWIAASVAFVFFAPALWAQGCPDGSDPDSLGCVGQTGTSSTSHESVSTLSVEERPQNDTPSADRSNEASAHGSLNSGVTYSEAAPQKGRQGSGSRAVSSEPPNAFQRFVDATTGQMPPIYGAKLFSTQPTSFGPIDHGPVPGELIIGPDDELRIRIWGQVNFSANLRVSREGEIYLPKVGAVHVAGMPFSAMPTHLRSMMQRVYRNFELSVDLGAIHSIQLYVSGMAHDPGEYTVSALSTLVDAVFACGGPAAEGSMRHLQLKREGKVVTDFDLYELLVKGDKSGDVQLQPGDVLYIPPAGPQVALLGSVRQAAIYELRGEESIGQLLDTAGGKTVIASGARLSVDRIEDHARRRAFELPTDSMGLATLLADGDIVRIDPIISIYSNAVTLRGAVANPGRFQWHEGMRLSELMPERDALVKRDYWWQRTQLGLPSPQLASPAGGEGHTGKPSALQSPGAQTNWNRAVIEHLDSSTMTTKLIPFNLGKLVLDHDMSQDLDLKAGDVVTIFAQQEIQLPIREQTIYVELIGEFVHPGIYSVSPGETLRSVVEHAGGLTDQAYLYGANFTRRSTRVLEQEQLNEYADRLEHQMERSSLGLVSASSGSGQQSVAVAGQQVKALNHELIARIRQIHASGRVVLRMTPHSTGADALPDMHLEDGDRLAVPFPPETVQVVGSVFNQHAFLYADHARVGEYLHLAGGPNREADRKRMFVLRADGSVSHHGSILDSDFKKLNLYPGDAIVVPEKDVHPSMLNQLLIWSQFMSQLSLSSIEVDLLK